MPHFTKRLKTEFGNPEFFFNRIFTVSGVRYHVSVRDDKRKSHLFNMDVKSGVWFIVNAPKTADWIIALESKLSSAIIEHKPFQVD